MKTAANKITGANAGGPDRLARPEPRAARIAQFYRSLAVELVLDGLSFSVAEKRAEGATSTHVSAKGLCDAIIVTSKANHGRDVRSTFIKAGIRRSEDVGRIVFSLLEQGLLRKREEDSLADFDGIFDTAHIR
jgi:uncharacterized repeat protein (TIGR04138 family)